MTRIAGGLPSSWATRVAQSGQTPPELQPPTVPLSFHCALVVIVLCCVFRSLQAFVALYNDRQLVSELMRVYDRDRNGALNKAEFTALGLGWGGMSEEASSILLAQFDEDGDGELSEAELFQLVKSGRELQKDHPPTLPEASPTGLDVNGAPLEGGHLWQYRVQPDVAFDQAADLLAKCEQPEATTTVDTAELFVAPSSPSGVDSSDSEPG